MVNYWDKYTEMHGQQNVKIKMYFTDLHYSTAQFAVSHTSLAPLFLYYFYKYKHMQCNFYRRTEYSREGGVIGG